MLAIRKLYLTLCIPLCLSAQTFAQDIELVQGNGQGNGQENYDIESPKVIAAARARIAKEFPRSEYRGLNRADELKILEKYKNLDPNNEVPRALLEDTLLYFDANQAGFTNQDYITVIDFSLRSDKARIFMVNMHTGIVAKFHTTHGVGSDINNDGFAEIFGNVVNSGKTSLGFARTTDLYSGHYGVSVRLDGLSTTNSKIRERAVVYHGWDQVYERNVIQGRSHGCITLDYAIKDGVLDKVKGGSLINFGFSKPPLINY